MGLNVVDWLPGFRHCESTPPTKIASVWKWDNGTFDHVVITGQQLYDLFDVATDSTKNFSDFDTDAKALFTSAFYDNEDLDSRRALRQAFKSLAGDPPDPSA